MRPRGISRLLGRYGAPALLAAVALFQAWQTQRYDLSPWKGGGFGMFSTVDDPSARFVRLYLVTDQGVVPAQFPEVYARRVLAIQTMPSPARLEGLARELATATWAFPDLPRRSFESAGVESLGTGETSEGEWPRASGTPPEGVTPLPLPLAEGEALPPGFTRADPRAVRLELWRFRFDQERVRLEVERLLDVEEGYAPIGGGSGDG